ncbi:hypothetical protein [Jeotgalibacillus salarius]|uniref:Uncharacterized protein n=1 Tax=Jeotgalibacillus salarius TaxID=546023 RepID=A0A4Y8LHL6_9BACL|nr:hypothetical protein [Jeotgalibacillus salarius]TFE02292.1 hypothetical protein E2626_06850 [Jeotgalibacillus salarius]
MKKKTESWKIWDAIFTSGFLSLFTDSEEARHDNKKFKQMLIQLIFSVLFATALFFIIFWLI